MIGGRKCGCLAWPSHFKLSQWVYFLLKSRQIVQLKLSANKKGGLFFFYHRNLRDGQTNRVLANIGLPSHVNLSQLRPFVTIQEINEGRLAVGVYPMTHRKAERSWLNTCPQLVCISIETNYLFVLLLYGHVYLGRSGTLVTVFLSHAWSGTTSVISWGGSSHAANLAWEIIPRLHFHSHFIQAV